jgi:hypothetical protein
LAKRKKVQDLKEEKSIRSVKLHFNRFSRFLRFLKENDAVIQLNVESGSSGQRFKQIYTAGNRDGSPSIEDLVADALNISGTMAREYTSRKLGIDDKHADVDKIYATGKVIDAVTFYSASYDPIDESEDMYTSAHPFSVQSVEAVDGNSDREGQDDAIHSTHPLSESFKMFPIYVLSELSDLFRSGKSLEHLSNPDELFIIEMKQLERIYGDSLTVEDERAGELIKSLREIEGYYYKFSCEKSQSHPILPDYPDFTIPHNYQSAYRSLEENIDDLPTFLQNPENTLADFLPYRYEILWRLAVSHYPVKDWPIQCHALLLLVHAEYVATRCMLLSCVDELMEDLKFIIFSTDDQQSLNLQRDSLSISGLAEALTRYNLRDGLEKTIQVSGTNLLTNSVFRFPEPHAAKGGYSSTSIEEQINKTLRNYLDQRIRNDLSISLNN